jgi:hypothetical protein
MRQPATIGLIATGCLAAALVFDRYVIRKDNPAPASELDGVWINGEWYGVHTSPYHETIRNVLLKARAVGYDFAQDFGITGSSGPTSYWGQRPVICVQPQDGNEIGGGFTLADVENWQSAGINYN